MNVKEELIMSEPLTKELNNTLETVDSIEINSPKVYNGDPKDMIGFAKFLVNELDIKIYNDILYFKDGLKFSSNQTKLRRAMANYLELRTIQDTEAINQMRKYAEYIETTDFKIRLRNGVIVEDNVIDIDCGFTPFFLDVTYDPNVHDEHVDNFLNFLCMEREDVRLVLEELLGYCLLVQKFPHKIFFLTGTGANGKSTFLEMITKWTGELSSHVDIANFDDGTSLASLIGKIVNIADDVDSIYIEKSKTLKTMASGNTVGTRAIYSQPITLKNTATLIFTANEPPTFKDKSDGIIRRIVVIPFENKVKERIYNLDDLLSSENAKSYILNLALAGVKRIYNNKLELSTSQTIINATKQYHQDNDSILAFNNDYPNIVNSPIASVYEAYIRYTHDRNQIVATLNMFSRRLKDLGYDIVVKKVNGKSTRVIILSKDIEN